MSENKSKRAKRDSSPGAAQVVDVQATEAPATAPQPQPETVATSPVGLVVQPPTAQASIVPVAKPAEEDEFGGVGEGFEGAHVSDNVMPAVVLMQGGNPEVKEKKANDGDFMIKMTGQVIDGTKGFLFVPVYFHRKFVHWNNRTDRGGNNKGFIKQYDDNDPFVLKHIAAHLGSPTAPVFGPIPVDTKQGEATSLVETKTLFGLMVDEDGQTQMVTIPCESSKIKAYNACVSTMRQFRYNGRALNTYNFMFRVTSKQEKDKKTGNYYADLKINPAAPKFEGALVTKNTRPAIFDMARNLLEDIKAGRKIAEEITEREETAANDTGASDGGRYSGQNGGMQPNADGDIPF